MLFRRTTRAGHGGRWVRVSTLALGVLLAACSNGSGINVPDVPSCPAVSGEFGPSACAYVRGVAVGSTGAPLTNIQIQVDSINPEGYGYASPRIVLGPTGRFVLTVSRIPPLGRFRDSIPDGIDTVTISFKAFRAGSTGLPSEVVGRATANLEFARPGAKVQPSTVEIRFGFP